MLIDSLDNGAEVHTGFAEIDVRPRKLAPGIFRRQYLEEHFGSCNDLSGEGGFKPSSPDHP